MVKRSIASVWRKALARNAATLGRSALRTGNRALTDAFRSANPRPVRRAAAKVPPPPDPGWTTGSAASGMASRRFRLYRPPGATTDAPLPLLVMLHGCGQDAEAFAASTRMNRLAARERFVVLWPEQDRLAHGHGCWNWYETRTGRAQVEAAVIVAAVDRVLALGLADPARVAIAGLSAGGSMAALVAQRFPDRFAAVALHSGVGPGEAHSTATALAAMQGRRSPASAADTSAGLRALPPLLVIQGSADGVVRPVNGRDAAVAWAAASGATPGPPRRLQRGERHPVQVTDFKCAGRMRVRLCEVDGLGHAWSGGARQAHSDPAGPDASRWVWRFASAAFAAATPVDDGSARDAAARRSTGRR